MKSFRFKKLAKRCVFNVVFGNVGRKRFVTTYVKSDRVIAILTRLEKNTIPRYRQEKIRRAHQGWRNRVFGTIQAIQVRLKYGRRPVTPQFRR